MIGSRIDAFKGSHMVANYKGSDGIVCHYANPSRREVIAGAASASMVISTSSGTTVQSQGSGSGGGALLIPVNLTVNGTRHTVTLDSRSSLLEGTQNAEAIRHGLMAALGLTADQVQVISPYAGGGFGQKNSLQMQTVLAAVAARRLQRPLKLAISRAQIFHDASFRAASRQRVRLGADRSGRMLAAIHEVDAQTSRHDFMPAEFAAVSSRLYGIENFRGYERLVRTDVQTPGYMRAPFEHGACFAMESCVDELAYALGKDPVALRLANDTKVDPITKLPLSSRHLSACLERGAERFGWSKRTMAPQSMRAGDGTLIGWGVAAGA